MKNKKINTNNNSTNLSIISLILIGIPIITAIVIIASYYIDGLGNVFTYVSNIVDYSGFKEAGEWHLGLLMLLPIISLSYYIG